MSRDRLVEGVRRAEGRSAFITCMLSVDECEREEHRVARDCCRCGHEALRRVPKCGVETRGARLFEQPTCCGLVYTTKPRFVSCVDFLFRAERSCFPSDAPLAARASMDFLKSAVASAIAKSSSFPYTIGDRIDNNESIWSLHNATKKVRARDPRLTCD